MNRESLLPAKSDWVRFQVKSDKRVLEGFVQEFSADGKSVRIGKAVHWPENEWYSLGDITILRRQETQV